MSLRDKLMLLMLLSHFHLLHSIHTFATLSHYPTFALSHFRILMILYMFTFAISHFWEMVMGDMCLIARCG